MSFSTSSQHHFAIKVLRRTAKAAASWCSAASAANGLPPLDQHQSFGNGFACSPLCHVFFHLLNRLNRLMVKTI